MTVTGDRVRGEYRGHDARGARTDYDNGTHERVTTSGTSDDWLALRSRGPGA